MSDSIARARDTGLSIVLILLLIMHFFKYYFLVPPALVILVLAMVFPRLFKPLSILWFGLSHILGTVMSNVLLSCLFLVVLCPIGIVRRIIGADSMKLKQWKREEGSVFDERNHCFTSEDLEHPY